MVRTTAVNAGESLMSAFPGSLFRFARLDVPEQSVNDDFVTPLRITDPRARSREAWEPSELSTQLPPKARTRRGPRTLIFQCGAASVVHHHPPTKRSHYLDHRNSL